MKKISLNIADSTSITSPSSSMAVDESTNMVQNQAFGEQSAVQSRINNQSAQETTVMNKKQKKSLTILCIVTVLAGIGTGFGAFKLKSKQEGVSSGPQPVQQIAEGQIKQGDVFGTQDSETFKDTAQGYLQAGGINGEGSHRLLRPGGKTQTVYLTSTVTDLDKLVGAEIKVWGETYKGQKAGWLMDVGKVEIIKVEGETPFEEEL